MPSDSTAPLGVLTVTYGEFTITDFDSLPTISKLALISSGLSHKLGNEAAADASDKMDQEIIDNTPGDAPGGDALRTLRVKWKAQDGNAARYEAWKLEARKEMFQSILDGKVGLRASGPRGPKLNEFDGLCRDIAYDEIGEFLVRKEILAKNTAGDYVLPGTNKRPVSGGKTPDRLVTIGSESYTMAQLVDRRLANPSFAPGIKAEATKRLAAKAKALAKISEAQGELAEML